MKKKVAVVIPFHKENMDKYEKISFTNNTKVLSKYPIFLILPNGLDSRGFTKYAPQINVVYFDNFFFETYSGSNQFWIRKVVYDYFKNYHYLLKCELDAFVFKDELNEWCNGEYDFIGAPWIDNILRKKMLKDALHSNNVIFRFVKNILGRKNKNKLNFVGNGGLSLRNVAKFRLMSRLLHLLIPNIHRSEIQEDLVWAIYASSYFPFFKVADFKKAARFSIETNAKKCFEINDGIEPFGCHAWYKYDLEFWLPFIQKRGYEIL